MSLNFEWDEAKNTLNICKHGIDFADVRKIFNLPLLACPDPGNAHGETRWRALGWLNTVLCLVVFTESDDGMIRIISARKVTGRERKRYAQILKD